jgi:RNA polymerase sigma-70 factor (ECF subfamily)
VTDPTNPQHDQGEPHDEPPTRPAAPDESRLVAGLRAGDEAIFREVFERIDPMLRRLVRSYISADAIAEEVVQETWVAVINGIDRFEGRSSLTTWIASILFNQARRHGGRERRAVPFAELAPAHEDGASVDPSRFQSDEAAWPGHWATPPRPWQRPERRLLSLELRQHLRDALEQLPERQRLVVALRDIDGCSSDEVCEILGLSAENQRVLLHRARSRLRDELEAFAEEEV